MGDRMKVGYIMRCTLCNKSVKSEKELKDCVQEHLDNHFPSAFARVTPVILADDEKKTKPKKAKKSKRKVDPIEEREDEEEDEEDEEEDDWLNEDESLSLNL